MNKNEAKALDALISLGPAGASDVHKYTNMPRNKAYESLEKLASRGFVEIQKGRPALYRVSGAKAVIESLVEDYSKEAKEALAILEKKQEEIKESASEADTYTWMVRGEVGVKRRLAELIYDAKQDIFAIGGYPPKYWLSVKTALKAAAKRGITVRPVCMVRPTVSVGNEFSSEERSFIEYRTVKNLSTLSEKMQPYDEKILGGFRNTPTSGGIMIIDESIAFDIVDDGKDSRKVSGIIFRTPGVPRIQKATAERIISLYTRKL